MDEIRIEKELAELKEQHSHIDSKLKHLMETPFQDQLRVMRLKRQKLQLKDRIFALEQEMYPDIIA